MVLAFKNYFQRLLNYLKLYTQRLKLILSCSKKWAILLMIVVPLQSTFPAITIGVANQLINQLSSSSDITWLLIGIWALTFLFGNLVSPIITFVQGRLTDKLTRHLNISIIDQAQSLQSIHYFEDHQLHNDTELISSESSWRPVNLLVFGTSVIGSFISFVSMIVLLSQFSWLITLILLITLIPQALLSYRIQQQAFETLVSNTEDSRKLHYYTQAVIDAKTIKEVRLFNTYNFFKDKYCDTFDAIKNATDHHRVKQLTLSVLCLTLTSISSIISFIYIIRQIIATQLDVGAILVFSSSIIYMLQSAMRLVEDSSLLYDTLLYMEKYFSFISLVDPAVSSDHIPFPEDFSSIHVRHLSFRYPGHQQQVLKNITFSVHKGEKIAIVGENGAGKSTLIKLLLRLYPCTPNSILFDQFDICQCDIIAYRKHFSAIFQDFATFQLTLSENITLSNTQSTSSVSIQDALSQAGIILDRFPATLDQQLGVLFDNGLELSGGQWQKVALARSIFADNAILILDEPTSSIDAATEFDLFQRFLTIAKSKTVFFVTHRLSMVKHADKVLVLKEGQVHGFDTHDTLYAHNEYYRKLYQMQAMPYQS